MPGAGRGRSAHLAEVDQPERAVWRDENLRTKHRRWSASVSAAPRAGPRQPGSGGRRSSRAGLSAPPPPPPPLSRTNWTRLVPPSVLTGQASSLLPVLTAPSHPAAETHRRLGERRIRDACRHACSMHNPRARAAPGAHRRRADGPAGPRTLPGCGSQLIQPCSNSCAPVAETEELRGVRWRGGHRPHHTQIWSHFVKS